MNNVNRVKWDSSLLSFAIMWKFVIDSFRERIEEKCDTLNWIQTHNISFIGKSTLLELSWNEEGVRLVWDSNSCSVDKSLIKSDKEIPRKIRIQTQDVDSHGGWKERTTSKKNTSYKYC